MKNRSKLLTSRFVVLSFNLAVAVGFSTKAYGPVDYVTIPVTSTKDSKAPYNPQDTLRMLQYWEFLCPGMDIPLPPPNPIPAGKCPPYDMWKMTNIIVPSPSPAPVTRPPSQAGQQCEKAKNQNCTGK